MIPGLEKHRNVELAERKEKLKKQLASDIGADKSKDPEKAKEAAGSSVVSTEGTLSYFTPL